MDAVSYAIEMEYVPLCLLEAQFVWQWSSVCALVNELIERPWSLVW
jgi:hypothetical protein